MRKTLLTACGLALLAAAAGPAAARPLTVLPESLSATPQVAAALAPVSGATVRTTVVSEEKTLYFVIHLKGGQHLSFPVEETPVVEHLGADFNVVTAASVRSVPWAEVEMFTLTEELPDTPPAGIDRTEDAQLSFGGHTVRLSHCRPGTSVRCHDAAGRLLETRTAGADGTVQLSLAARPAGTYVITTGTHTFKIIRK